MLEYLWSSSGKTKLKPEPDDDGVVAVPMFAAVDGFSSVVSCCDRSGINIDASVWLLWRVAIPSD